MDDRDLGRDEDPGFTVYGWGTASTASAVSQRRRRRPKRNARSSAVGAWVAAVVAFYLWPLVVVSVWLGIRATVRGNRLGAVAAVFSIVTSTAGYPLIR